MCRDGLIRFIYVHHNAYPESLGRLLVESYATYDKVVALIKLGDCSVVRPALSDCQPYGEEYQCFEEPPSNFFEKLERDIEAVYLFQLDSEDIFSDEWKPTADKLEEWAESPDTEDEDSEEHTEDSDPKIVATPPIPAEKGIWLVKTIHPVNLHMFIT